MTPPTVWLDAYLLSQFAVPSIQAHANTLVDVRWAMAACVSTACKLSETGLLLRVHHTKQAPERKKTMRHKLRYPRCNMHKKHHYITGSL